MRPTLKTGARAALAVLGLALAALSWSQIREHRDFQKHLGDLASRSGVIAHDPGLIERLEREPDPWRARLLLARAMLASVTEAGEPGQAGPDGLDLTLRRLDAARSLASRVAVERPASWEAPMVQGAATYVGWLLRRDRRLITHPEEWENPLLRSLELAPGRPEPARFLAAAYMELWPALSRGKRETARALLARSLVHRPTFETLIELWLRTAGSHAEAFSAVPGEPWAWERIQQFAARDADWPAYVEARRRWYAAQEERLRRDLAEAEARLRGGDEVRARELFLGMMQVPPRHRFVPVLESALAQCPPGPAGSSAPAVRAWLDWSLDLCSWRSCPLSGPMLRRLAELAGEVQRPAEALSRPGELKRTEWTFRDWTLHEPAPRLEMVPAGPAPGFTLEVIGAPDAGAGVEVRLDGDVIAMAGVRRGQLLTLRKPLDTRPHLLEIEAVSGGHLVPGAVRLLPGS